MTRQKNSPVEMQEKRFGYFPHAFMWHGKCYHVSKIEKSWTTRKRKRKGHTEHRYFRVCCEEGTFDLTHNLIVNTENPVA